MDDVDFGFWIPPPDSRIPGVRQAAEAPDLPVLAVEPNRFTWEKAASEAQDLDLSVSFVADLEEASSVQQGPPGPIFDMGLSENSVPLQPMVLLIIMPTKWL